MQLAPSPAGRNNRSRWFACVQRKPTPNSQHL
jgi:hypothetical protein